MRLPRQASLKDGRDFGQVRKHGKSSAGRYLVLGAYHDPQQARFRVGFITTRKISNAVFRNRLRRQFRAIVRKHGDRIRTGFSLVSIARFRAPGTPFSDLERDWLKQAKRLQVLTD